MAATGRLTSAQQRAQRLSAVESHSASATPPAVQRTWLPPPPTVGQTIESQAPAWQSTSHWHALAHWTSPQALRPVQAIVQRASLAQTISLQAPSPTQLMVQFHPEGQSIVASQSSVLEHSIWQVRAVSSHDVQSLGHCGTMQ